ncbi:MFS transporter [Yinghuangia aomiensis]
MCSSRRRSTPGPATSRRRSPYCCCPTRSSARSPACCSTGGGAARCWCGAICCAPGWSWRPACSSSPGCPTRCSTSPRSRCCPSTASCWPGCPRRCRAWSPKRTRRRQRRLPTAGTVAASAGALAAVVVHLFVPAGTVATALVIFIAAALYVGSAAVAATMAVDLLGPDPAEVVPRVRDAVLGVARGLRDGARHVRQRRAPADALLLITAMRFCFGVLTVMTLLLCRNVFNDPADTDKGLATLGVTVAVTAAGFFVAAVVTPIVAPRIGVAAWIVVCAGGGAVGQLPIAVFQLGPLLVAAFLLGLVSQGAKIGVDTIVQTTVDDAYRGRVFSVYDVLFNVSFVGAAAVAAVTLPADGRSVGVLLGVAALYAAAALLYALAVRRRPPVEAVFAAQASAGQD